MPVAKRSGGPSNRIARFFSFASSPYAITAASRCPWISGKYERSVACCTKLRAKNTAPATGIPAVRMMATAKRARIPANVRNMPPTYQLLNARLGKCENRRET